VQRVSEFHHDVVDDLGEPSVEEQLDDQAVLLLDPVRLAEPDNRHLVERRH
jgi:hypothetical protein